MSPQLVTDVNIAVAAEVIQAIGNLARGLRAHFAGSSRFLLPVLLVRYHNSLGKVNVCVASFFVYFWCYICFPSEFGIVIMDLHSHPC